VDFLGRHATKVPVPPEAPPPKPIHGALWGSFISVPGGQVHAYMNDDVSTLPIVLQHDAVSSVAAVEAIGRGLIGRRTVLAFDLPGMGDSDNTVNVDSPDVGYFADSLRAVLDVFDLAQVDFFGMRGGGIIGLEMALRKPAGIRRLVMSSAYQARGHEERFSEAMKEIAPHWYGGHLLECWHHMRDEALYYPWFDKTRGAVVKREPMLDPNLIHMRVCSLLKAGNNYQAAYRACVAYPTHEKLAQCQAPTILGTTKWDPNNASTAAAAKAAPKSKLRQFDDDISRWAEGFIDILESADHAG
jgi:pimeloyl-ACP methyl ester carboxylesterase